MCPHCYKTPEPTVVEEMGLLVEIPNVHDRSRPTTLVECLKRFCASETLDKNNSYICSGRCKRPVRATKRVQFNPSHILIITLKRFQFRYERAPDGTVVRTITTKINSLVTFPMEDLDLAPYSCTQASGEQNLYRVFGVQCHTGKTADSGHYYSYVLTFGGWLKYNDKVVTPVDPGVVASDKNVYSLYYSDQANFGKLIGIRTLAGKEVVFVCLCLVYVTFPCCC